MIKIKCFTFNDFLENTYIVFDDSKTCVIIDPGCYTKEEQQVLKNFITSHKLTVKYILNTHCHIDHILGNAFCKKEFKAPLLAHVYEKQNILFFPQAGAMFGIEDCETFEVDAFFTDKQSIFFGKTCLETFFVPGHSPGHVAFYCEKENFCVSGDVLFFHSIGRTDLPGGDYQTLMKSIYQTMYLMPDETVLYTGHGEKTTIIEEKKNNPFCKVE